MRRAWVLSSFAALLAVLALVAIAQQRVLAGEGKTAGVKSHPGKIHRKTGKGHRRCVVVKPKRAHAKTGRISANRGSARKPVHVNKRKKCSIPRRTKKPLIHLAPFAPSPSTSAPVGIAPTLTPPATAPPVVDVPPKPFPSSGCFAAPGACGFPDPAYANVGPAGGCASLAPSGEVTVTTAGATVEGKNIVGGVNVEAKNVTLTNDCITADGGGSGGSAVVSIGDGDPGTRITYSDISGANGTSEAVEEALSNNNSNSSTSADHDYIYNCGECVHGEWTLTNSYVIASAIISGAHYEDIYCNDETFIAEHDVLINPHEQTANLFCDTGLGGGGPGDNHITVTGSLLGGSGYSLYPQGNSTSVGSSTMTITGNRFTRCLGKPIFDGFGNRCEGLVEGEADAHGYYPNGGFYGTVASMYCPPTPGQEWSGNVWDDNGATVGC
jgi:hypothetical protein